MTERLAPVGLSLALARRLLADEPVDPTELAELDYEFHGFWHLGVIAMGAEAEKAVRYLATSVGRELLSVSRGTRTVWAWLGGRQKLAVTELERLPSACRHIETTLVIGEPERGIEGWRLTHQQAQAALRVVPRTARGFARYADVALPALAFWNEPMARSFVRMHLSPLDGRRCPAETLRVTLHAFFASGRNSSSAASALGISRRTMRNRMAVIEECLGERLLTHHAELDLALRLDSVLDGYVKADKKPCLLE